MHVNFNQSKSGNIVERLSRLYHNSIVLLAAMRFGNSCTFNPTSDPKTDLQLPNNKSNMYIYIHTYMLHFSDSNLPTLKKHQQKIWPSKALSAFSPGERSWSPPSRVASQPRCSSNRWGLAHSNSPRSSKRIWKFGRSKVKPLFDVSFEKNLQQEHHPAKIQRSHEARAAPTCGNWLGSTFCSIALINSTETPMTFAMISGAILILRSRWKEIKHFVDRFGAKSLALDTKIDPGKSTVCKKVLRKSIAILVYWRVLLQVWEILGKQDCIDIWMSWHLMSPWCPRDVQIIAAQDSVVHHWTHHPSQCSCHNPVPLRSAAVVRCGETSISWDPTNHQLSELPTIHP